MVWPPASAMRTSRCGRGVPIVCALVNSSSVICVWIAFGDSDWPYATTTAAPNACSTRRISDGGTVVPPDCTMRNALRSVRAKLSCSSNASCIVGTPPKIVAWVRAMSSSTAPGSNAGSNVTLAPTESTASTTDTEPPT